MAPVRPCRYGSVQAPENYRGTVLDWMGKLPFGSSEVITNRAVAQPG